MVSQKKKDGFTLIELLVVIALMLSILAIAVVSFINISNKKKEEAWQLVKQQIETAANEYLTANEYLFEGLTGDLTGYISVGKLVEEDYLNKVTDPRTGSVVSNKTYVEVKKNNNKLICKYNENENNENINQNEYVIYFSEIGAPKISVSIPNTDDENLKINNGWYNKKTAPDGVVFSFSFGENDDDEISTDKISVNSIETTEKPLFSSDSNLKIYESINGGTKSDITDEIGYYNTSNMNGIKVDFKRILNIQGENTVTYTVTKNGKSSIYYTDYKLDNEPPSINNFNVTGNVLIDNTTRFQEKFYDEEGYLRGAYGRDMSMYKILYDVSKLNSDNKFQIRDFLKFNSFITLNNNIYHISDRYSFINENDLFVASCNQKEISLSEMLELNPNLNSYDFRRTENYNGNIINISGNINDNFGVSEKEITYIVNNQTEEKNYFAENYLLRLSDDDFKKIYKMLNQDGITKSETEFIFIDGFAKKPSTIPYNERRFYRKTEDDGTIYNLFSKNDTDEQMIEKIKKNYTEYLRIRGSCAYNHSHRSDNNMSEGYLKYNHKKSYFGQKDIYDKNYFPDTGDFNLKNLIVDIPIDTNQNIIKFKLKVKDKAGNVSEREFIYNTYVSCREGNKESVTTTSPPINYIGDCQCECTGEEYTKTCQAAATDTTTTYDKKNKFTCSVSSTPSVVNVKKTCSSCPPVTNPNIEVDTDIETSDLEAFDSSDEQEMLESFDGD